MGDWLPIESAPRDEPVLVYGLWAGEVSGQWDKPVMMPASYAGPGGDFPGFDWVCEGTSGYAAWMKPSHWMPLPDPPAF